MPPDLVTIEEALAQIRGEEEADAPWLLTWIPIISSAVRSWLKDDWRLYQHARDSGGDIILDESGNPVPDEDSNGPIVHPCVKGAVLLELASQYRFREGEGDNRMESMAAVTVGGAWGFTLSRGATALLSALRKPTVA